uniref:Uncharacterized protein n=1 Tax=Haptolina ericina TaxID=156174 RepID=A0A7S3F357_9EUKA|mmetsp:Transcript_50887/g.114431  ORF Transcript_50887/g.114431 Transcript_50887/m.114431 type:complete len:279 (+) Transcript_50887:62-898(+)|eukprot:CAMPEP_0181187440 /NCGR_PEP_ID=MMETSP1096-20121128/10573_1 /TAXON_ID=156174 ORGANISM="Chrysochromulina ericina, Strain CCMP281" /NCGR_SAMPLE_ID=MMETSP1096 /ASSEMBLY_ACC=CAM_ASM_000453 /LENGTH=278 /DNA_ID=CAMNT_0023276413 /DNA_START=39 /DNA_END=875 /DNA_ORIENTATION=+
MPPACHSVAALKDFVQRLSALPHPGRVTLKKESSVAILTLSNPERRNAMSGPMMAGLADAVKELEMWNEGVAVILTGEGGTFCSGLDYELARGGTVSSPQQATLMSQLMTDTLHRLRQLPLLSVAAIDGFAIGGGAELTTATDWRVMASDAQVRFVHARMGATTGWGGGARLVGMLGRARALKLLAHGTPLDGNAAFALGLCDGVAQAGETAASAAARLLIDPAIAHSASVQSLRAIKSAFASASDIPPEVRAEETQAIGRVWGSEANRNALTGQRST